MKDILSKIVDNVEEFFLKIFEKVGLKKFVDWYMEHQEGMRYLVFGGLSTIVNILVFMIVSKLFNLDTVISNSIAWIVAVIFAYITNKICVFKAETKDGKDFVREIISFFGARVGTLVIETIFLKIVIDYLYQKELLMKIISNIIVIVLNFIFSKLFIFKQNNEKQNSNV